MVYDFTSLWSYSSQALSGNKLPSTIICRKIVSTPMKKGKSYIRMIYAK